MNRKLLPLLMLMIGYWSTAFADHLSSSLLFTARMSGNEEVPAVVSNGQGLGILSFDEKKSTLYINVSLSNLSGPITGIHIHEGAVGINGPVVINLTPFLQGNRVKGAIQNITRATFAKFVSGDFYLNAHTEMHPGGEIRGQIQLETDFRYYAQLNGTNEVPSVSSNGKGLFIANLTKSGKSLDFNMVFEGLSSAVVGAHIHEGASGTNGGVIFDLSSFLAGNVLSGTWEPGDFLAALRAGDLYVNVHTVNNPGGEIRGQLRLDEGLTFDVLLNGGQEFPAIDVSGTGLGVITVSPDLSTLQYYILLDSLTGPVTGAHFHAGNAGANGPVVVDLSGSVNGNVIIGSTPISIELLNRMLAGGLYLNVHTAANPGGEIRGQVYKLAREAYTFDLNGGQEVPPTNSTGTGAGIVTIDRNQSNAHYMIVYSNLQGVFTASHFHNGAPGTNGGVIFDLTSSFNGFGGAYGYWDTGFDATTSLMFRQNLVYANVHTDLFPGGEIRGNILRSRDLFTEQPFDPRFGNDFILAAEMNGDSENPPVTTTAVGLATVYFDEDRTSAKVNVTVSGLSGPITGAHIHEGVDGTNGPVVFPLTFLGNRIQTEITGLTSEQIGKFNSGNYYVNIHTAANPGGEIRGQLMLEQDVTFVATLSGNQEVPAVTTDARGLAAFHYTIGQLTMDVNIQMTELSSPITGAHLHMGAPGVNGSVIIDLGSLRTGNTIQGTVDLTILNLLDLEFGNVYVNIHTMNNPGGEIRGQLELQNGLTFDGWMSGLQEVPFATTAGSGLAVATLSNDLTFVDVKIVTDAMSGTIAAGHFHNAPLGSNGPVVLDLSGGLNDNDINFSIAVSDAIVDALLTGNIYANVHTPAFPGGEIRGQLFRLARDGYGYDICPEQETNPINAPFATGSGLVSIDRLHSNANLSGVITDLSGVVNSAHFHRAPIGVNGSVFIDLSPFIANGSFFGAGIPFDTSIINPFITGNAYFNAHTTLHPGGEVRGQVVKEFLCSIEVGVNELERIVSEVILSPVPVTDRLNISIETIRNTTLSIHVIDMSGKLMSMDSYQITEGKNILEVETESLHPGFYMLMISDGNAAQAYKFVK